MTALFGVLALDQMNETDVEQVIVRPFCHALGYRQGTEANIRTQVSLRYGKAYLGHKDDARDPVLRGKPDFVCEVIPYARWVIEAKSPAHALALEDSQQAHTYATHPEIAAEFYILTNGREFRVYRIGRPDQPLMAWQVEETDGLLLVLQNLLGPDAMRKRAHMTVDLGKPLALGVGSSVEIVGGQVIYDHHSSSLPITTGLIDGLRNGVSGVGVTRTAEGFIEAVVKVDSAYIAIDAMNEAMGLKSYMFRTSDEFVSTDISRPTLFQNIFSIHISAGTVMPKFGTYPSIRLPFGFDCTCYTQALGYLDGTNFRGTFNIDYDYLLRTAGTAFAGRVPTKAEMKGEGRFELVIR